MVGEVMAMVGPIAGCPDEQRALGFALLMQHGMLLLMMMIDTRWRME